MSIVRGRLGGVLGLLLVIGGSCATIVSAHNVMVASLAALTLVALVPGVLVAALVCANAREMGWIEYAAIALGLGIATMVLGTMALHQIRGPLTQRMMLSGYVGLDLVLLVAFLLSRRTLRLSPSTWTRKQALILIAIVVVAVALRVPLVGYSEFQGDEGRAALRAAEVIQGYDEVLLIHKKGPVEILLPTALYATTLRLTEATARLPLALANVAFLVALAYLGRRFFSAWVGIVAAAVLTVDGFVIGFARLLQYQSVIVLTTTLVLLLIDRATEREHLDRRLVWGAALLAATALLAHYEAVFVFPAAVWIVARWAWRHRHAFWRVAGDLALPIVAGAALVAWFYVPFVLHPQFAETSVYLTERRVGHGLFYSSLADYFERAGFYSSTYYVIGMALALAVGCGGLLWRRYGAGKLRWLVIALAPLWVLAIGRPTLWNVGGVNLTVLLFATTGVLAWLAVRDDKRRTALVWFGAPALFYFFMMTKVHTHYYGALPGWSLLVGWSVVSGVTALEAGRWARPVLVGVVATWWALCLGYVAVAFCRTWPEFKAEYPMAKPTLYWSPFEQPPKGGYFGFPYRTAWKTIGAMYANGMLTGPYDSNDEDLVTNWYTRGQVPEKGCDTYILARDLESTHAVPPTMLDGTYRPMYEITRGGVGQLWVFRRGYSDTMHQIAAEGNDRAFDELMSTPFFYGGAPLDERFIPEHVVNAQLGGMFELVGWSLNTNMAEPGDYVLVTLYWRSLSETDAGYNVFASLGDGEPVATIDAVPNGGESPTWRWTQGQEIVDKHLLRIESDAADGVYPLRVGMVDYVTRDRLAIQDALQQAMGSSLHLTDIRVGQANIVSALHDPAISATFGEGVLVTPVPDVDLTLRAGDTVRLDVNWYCVQPVGRSLTVFVQCLGPDGRPYGQVDTLPVGGALPTSYWQANERVSDSYAVILRDDAPVGEYRIVMGLYDAATGVREPVALRGQPQPDGMLTVGRLEVSE